MSALYEGTLVHARMGDVPHRFERHVYLHYLDLDELDASRLGPLLTRRVPGPVWFRERDYLDGVAGALAPKFRRLVADELGAAPAGPVRLLTTLRTWGWCFNPLSLAYLFDADGERVEAVVATVTNTPWGERASYVLDARAGLDALEPVDKRLFVSPFLSPEGSYRFRLSVPGERLTVSITLTDGGAPQLVASMHLQRLPLRTTTTARLLVQRPAMAHRVSLGIYREALALLRKGAPTVRHR